MAYDNINFKYSNMYVLDGYFYTLDHSIDALVKKVDDGSTAFTYPLDTLMSSAVKSLEYGGGYFWTLEDNDAYSATVRKWKIDNYICKLQNSYILGKFVGASNQNIISDYFDDTSYDPPWTKYGPSGSIITVVSGEAIVKSTDFGTAGASYDGPYIEVNITNTSDFDLECRFRFNMTSTVDRFVFKVALLNNGVEYLRAQAYDTSNTSYLISAALYYKSSVVYSASSGHGLVMGSYNIFRITKSGTAISFKINGVVKYSGTVDTSYVNKLQIYFQKYGTPPQFIATDYITLSGTKIHAIDSDTFSVESYTTTNSSGISPGDNYFYISNYSDVLTSGTEVFVGPDTNNEYSYKTITSVSGNKVFVSTPYSEVIDTGSNVEFNNNLWVFDNYTYDSYTLGSLYKFKASDMSYVTHYNDPEYYNVKASSFLQNATLAFGSTIPSVVYVKSTNLKFIDVDNISNVSFMTMDNIRIDGTTVIPVYDMSIFNDTVYRLQAEATYYGTNNSWSTYNYQTSPIRRFVDSITVDATNKILNSDGVSTTEVISTVFDQYNDPMFMKLVFFSDNNPTGYMTISPAFTRSNGVAYSYYRAGTSPAHVTITATATQND